MSGQGGIPAGNELFIFNFALESKLPPSFRNEGGDPNEGFYFRGNVRPKFGLVVFR